MLITIEKLWRYILERNSPHAPLLTLSILEINSLPFPNGIIPFGNLQNLNQSEVRPWRLKLWLIEISLTPTYKKSYEKISYQQPSNGYTVLVPPP